MTEGETLSESLTKPAFIDKTLSYALNRNPALSNFDREEVNILVKRATLEMAAFENLARTSPLRIPETPEGAKKIKAIWDLSAIGTYLKEFQDDRWRETAWAGWTDRRRLNYSGALIRRLTEKITGKSLKIPKGQKPSQAQIDELKSDIEEFGPYLIYGSTTEQNEDLQIELEEAGVVIPSSKVYIIETKDIGTNTIDQMKTFRLPPDLEIEEGDILAIVAHAPHLVRALHLANRYNPFPKGLVTKPYPLPSPLTAGTDYATQEISGLLYYAFITNDAALEPYPYQI